jgi:hypothetical protein
MSFSVTPRPSCSHYNCRLLSDVIAAAVDAVTTTVLDCVKRGDAPTADALRLLLRAYAATGRDDVRETLEPALARALEIAADSSSMAAAGWLMLFAEAADASDDMRLRDIASDLAAKARENWRDVQSIGARAESVDACLRALPLLPDGSAQTAIDELERLIAVGYEPGRGIIGSADDEVHVASALLTAFGLTDRLPYAMLAEELLQRVRRFVCDATTVPFSSVCAAAAALSRMAALHQVDDYRNAAVIAPNADYRADAVRMLEQVAPEAHTYGIGAAPYALAAGELQSAFR